MQQTLYGVLLNQVDEHFHGHISHSINELVNGGYSAIDIGSFGNIIEAHNR